LAAAAGACYVARWTTAQPKELKESIKKAINMKGFRFIEATSQCQTAYGRRAGFKNAGEMLKWFKENAIPIEQAEKMDEESLAGKIVVGEFVQRQRPTLVETVYKMIEEAKSS
jgi:2-oxoglutarate ferredoxin oxidoreductase subunit beta